MCAPPTRRKGGCLRPPRPAGVCARHGGRLRDGLSRSLAAARPWQLRQVSATHESRLARPIPALPCVSASHRRHGLNRREDHDVVDVQDEPRPGAAAARWPGGPPYSPRAELVHDLADALLQPGAKRGLGQDFPLQHAVGQRGFFPNPRATSIQTVSPPLRHMLAMVRMAVCWQLAPLAHGVGDGWPN